MGGMLRICARVIASHRLPRESGESICAPRHSDVSHQRRRDENHNIMCVCVCVCLRDFGAERKSAQNAVFLRKRHEN